MIAYNNNGQLVTLASGQRMWIGTTAAHEAAIQAGTMPNNCTVAIIDEAQSTLDARPRSTGSINLANDAGALAESISAATEYTVSEDGMIIAHIVKTAGGNTCMMTINGAMVDSFPYYTPTVYETVESQTEITLSAFARKGDKVKVYCDGNGTKYCLAKLFIQPISWMMPTSESSSNTFYNDVSATLKAGNKEFASTATAAQTWTDSYTIPSDGFYVIHVQQLHQTMGVASFNTDLLVNSKKVASVPTTNTWQANSNCITLPLKAGTVVSVSTTRDAVASTGGNLGYIGWWVKQMQ